MKIYIQTDIEGIAGYVFFENMDDKSIENHEHRMRMKILLIDEVNAAVRSSFDAGASYVVINDNHRCAYNILFEELDPCCEIIHQGVKREIINRKKISPYKIQGRVSLNLLERLNPNIKRKRLKKDVVADTITEAFDKAVAQFPWSNYGLQKIDGFQYPSIGYQGNHGKIEDKRKRTLENQEKK